MKKGNSMAWGILTEDEKSSLLLSINYQKSTWQAGEIMNKAHYKYLEIQARANKFFKMFNEYFIETGNLKIPPNCNINQFFRDYLILTIFERKDPKEAIREMGKNPFILKSARDRIFKEQMDLLANHEEPEYQLLYDLIIEFDRWNNSRILPISLQEPSAFKRRNKTRLIKHLKNLANLSPFHIQRFEKKFKALKHRKALYITILGNDYESGYEIIKINKTAEAVEYISKTLRLFLFKEYVDADNFGYLVNKYLNNPKKTCRDGQKFWPTYRKTIELAYNYNDVNNIIPRRKNLEKAFKDMDNIVIKQQEKKASSIADPQKRADDKSFWTI